MTLFDQEKIFKTMIELAHDGFLFLDSCGIIIQVNQAACSICGFLSADDIKQQPLKFTVLFDLYDFNDNIVPVEQSPVSRALNGEIITDFKGKGIRKDTGKVWHGLYSAIPMFDETKKIVGVVLSIKDISDSVQLVNECEKEKEKNRSIIACMVEGAVIAAYDYDIPAGRATVNPEYEIMLEYTPGEIQLTLDWWTNSIHPEERGRARSIMDDCIYGKLQSYKMEFRMRTKSGEWKWILCQGRNVEYDKQGKPIRMLGTHIDITERKRTEDALRDERNKLMKIADTLPGVIFSYHQRPDGSAHLTYASPAYFTILGLNPKEMEKDTTPVFTFIHPDDIGPVKESIAQSARTLSSWHREFRYNHPHKGEVWIEAHSVPERDIEGGIIWHGFITDITERRRAQEAMEKMSSILSEGQKIAHLGTFEFIANTQATIWSEEEYRIFGLDPKEPSPAYDVMLARNVHHDDAALLDKTFTTAIQSSSVFECEHRVVRPDGKIRWVFSRAHPYFDRDGKLVRYVGVSLDITERKQMEKKLAEHTRFVESIISMTPDILYIYDIIDNVNVYINRSLEKILGYSEKEIQSMGNQMIPSLMHPDDLIKYRRIIIPKYTQAKDNESIIHEYRMKHKAGGWRWLVSNETIYLRQPDGSPRQVFGLVHDITERKKTEEALQESEYFFKESQRAANIGSYKLNFTTGYWKSSEVLDQIFGIDQNYTRSIQGWLDIVHPDDRTMMDEYLREVVISKNIQFTKEYRIIRKSDGIMRWVDGLGRITFDSKGTLISMLGTIQDITERKRAEEARNRLTRELRALSSCNQALIHAENEQALLNDICHIVCEVAGYRMTWVGFIVNGKSSYIRVVAAAGFGASLMIDETITLTDDGKTPIDTAVRSKVSCTTPDFTNAPTGTLWSNYALKNDCRSAIALPILEEAGNPLGVLSIYSGEPDVFAADEIKLLEELAGDLSFGIVSLRTRVERGLAQKALIYEKELSDALIEASPGIFFVMDRTGRTLRMNTNFMKLQGLTRETFTSQDPLKFVYRDDYDLSKRNIEQMLEIGYVEADIRFEFMPGEISWWRMSGHAVTITGTVYLISSGSDITSRKHMEENLQIAIRDKEILLQELYHRTKNNMQVISAYLAMQAIALDDEKLQTIFNEMENRIRAMALVHEKLYESKDLTNINLREYLSDLSRLIFKNFPGASDKVTLVFDVEEISVTIDIAIPIGLVTTELLTNSLKYAFPEGRSGKILLLIQKHDRGQLELVISDNGVGVRGTFDFTQKNSIGIPTVLSIVRKQLHGSSELDTAKGFNWKFIFRSDLYSKRV